MNQLPKGLASAVMGYSIGIVLTPDPVELPIYPHNFVPFLSADLCPASLPHNTLFQQFNRKIFQLVNNFPID